VRPLAPSPAWTLVTPYCKRTRPGRGTNTKAAGFPPLSRLSPAASLPPFALGLASTHLGWGTRRHSLVGLGTPPVSKRRQAAMEHKVSFRDRICFLDMVGLNIGFVLWIWSVLEIGSVLWIGSVVEIGSVLWIGSVVEI
jgi:hypothetical protein